MLYYCVLRKLICGKRHDDCCLLLLLKAARYENCIQVYNANLSKICLDEENGSPFRIGHNIGTTARMTAIPGGPFATSWVSSEQHHCSTSLKNAREFILIRGALFTNSTTLYGTSPCCSPELPFRNVDVKKNIGSANFMQKRFVRVVTKSFAPKPNHPALNLQLTLPTNTLLFHNLLFECFGKYRRGGHKVQIGGEGQHSNCYYDYTFKPYLT